MDERRTCTTAFQTQDAVTVTRTKMYTTFDFVGRGKLFTSSTRPVMILANAPTIAVRKEASARERTVK